MVVSVVAIQASSVEYPCSFWKRRAAGDTEAKRGEAIIVSMEYFPPGRDRPGASVDRGKLQTLFGHILQFNVTAYVDMAAEKLKDTVRRISETKLGETPDCFVLFVSAHGHTDKHGHYIESDSKVYVYTDLLKPLMTCDALKDIPKVFFINACRGDPSENPIRSKESVEEYIKTGKDSLVMFSTEEGNQSVRDTKSGTFFVQALYEAISLNLEKDVGAMTIIANKILIKNSAEYLKSVRWGALNEKRKPKGKKRPEWQVAPIHFNLTGKLFWRTQSSSESTLDHVKNVGNVAIGQDDQREKLKRWLLSRETRGASAADGTTSQSFLVSGVGGIGKTTLAKSLYEDEEIKYYYDHRVYWVTLKKDPDIVKLQRRLISEICKETPSMKLDTQKLLLDELKIKLSKTRRIFLILDDVWEKQDVDSLLGYPFLKTLPRGSKCIITSRKPVEWEKLDANIQFEKLGLLNDKDARELFCWKAFGEKTIPEIIDPRLKDVVNEVIVACGNMPILLSTIGADRWGIQIIESWEEIRDRLKGTSEEKMSDDESAKYERLVKQLMIIYDDLPEWDSESGEEIDLKEYFLDFAAFPEREEIEIAVLMDLWTKPGLTEDEAFRILEELEERCLVMIDGHWCRVHDIFRNMAVKIVEKPELRERKRLFAWGISNSRLPEQWEISQNVRSQGPADDSRGEPVIFETEKMVITKSELKEFHPKDAILFRSLKHLRMLSLTSNLNLVSLPSAVGHLRSLEKLDLSWCLGLKRLPREIGQLESLEKLNMAGCCSLIEIPAEVGRLKKLVELNLQSCGLERVPDEIGELTRLTYLCLNDCNRLTALPDAMGNLSSLEKLECELLGIEEIPRALGNLRKLKHLSFAACGGITKIPVEFVKLENLISFRFSACHQLVVVPYELDALRERSLDVFDVRHTRVVIKDLPPGLRALHESLEGNSRGAKYESEAEADPKLQGSHMRGVLVDPASVFHPSNKEERRASFGLSRIISMVKTEPFVSVRFDTAIRIMYTMANHDGTRHAIVRSGGLPVLLRCIDKGKPQGCGHNAAATLRNICITYSTHKAVVDAGALRILTRVLNRRNSDIRFYAFQALRLIINGDIAEGDYLFTTEINELCGHRFIKCMELNGGCIYCLVEQEFENDPEVRARLKS